ncbi:MAG: aminotransferase class V-fold PLP-dependent enzyme [Chloroflexi bacterium]|nr:aminotransferase class V-fold PLP-dependent enzyme [Chloroflexota bacterium]
MQNLKSLFLLDPDVTFLNHGSFGATPKPVFDAYQAWQRRLERQPVQFILTELWDLLAQSRQALGKFVNANADDLVYIPNPTFGINIVARSLDLTPGDEVLTTNHEYGACDNVWNFLSQKRGFQYKQHPISLPIATDDEIVEQLWQSVTLHTKVIFLSHITSSTALRLPVATICKRARAAGILTIIDGAHVPGQIPVDLEQIGADFYLGNLHKWVCAPKGAAFLHARAEMQSLIEPLVVGWGWGEDRSLSFGSDFIDYNQWLGTDDLSSYLTVPTAIEFQAQHEWTAVRAQCHQLLTDAVRQVNELTDLPSPYPDHTFYHQMAIMRIPFQDDLQAFKSRFYAKYKVEVPFTQWQDQQFMRISVQGYNTKEDLDQLLYALKSEITPHPL